MKRQQGFTLLEVLVAIAILSVMSVMSYSGIEQVTNARQKTDLHAKNLNNLQMAFSLIQKDLEQVVNRRTRDQLGTIKAPFSSLPDSNIVLSLVANNRSTLQTDEISSRLQYVEYHLDEDKLIRTQWNILDRAHNSEVEGVVILENLDLFELQFFSQGKSLPFWPMPGGNQLIDLPVAVEINIAMNEGMEVQRLFLLPGKIL